ncbi:hypothetical protein BGY98DRAFT_1034495, partial [Russula aff. rugulosa BPL654]
MNIPMPLFTMPPKSSPITGHQVIVSVLMQYHLLKYASMRQVSRLFRFRPVTP